MRSASKLVLGLLLLALSGGWLWWAADARTRALLETSAVLGLAVVAIAVPCGVLLAFLITRTNVYGRTAAGAALIAMLLVPLYLQAAGWDAGFGRMGWATLARDAVTQPWLSGMRGAVWVHSLAAIPWVVLLAGSGLRFVDRDGEEAALLDWSPAGVIWRVTLPAAAPAIAAAALWTVVVTTSEMIVTDLYQVRTIAEEIYTSTQMLDVATPQEAGEPGVPRALAALVASGLAALFVAALLARQSLRPPHRPPLEFDLGAWRVPATGLVVLAVLLITTVPLASLVYNAGVTVENTSGLISRSWTGTKLLEIVGQTPRKFSTEIGWTVLLGCLSATGCLAAATPLAFWGRRGGWRSLPGLMIAGAGLAVPGPLISLAIIRLLNQPDLPSLVWAYDHTLLAPWVATSLRACPAAILVTWIAILSLPSDLLDAAAVDGLGPLAQFRRVVLPLRWPGLAIAWLAAFLVATGDLSASILVTPPGLFTLPARVFGLLHAGVDDQVAGLCLVSLLGYLLVCLAVAGLLYRRSPA